MACSPCGGDGLEGAGGAGGSGTSASPGLVGWMLMVSGPWLVMVRLPGMRAQMTVSAVLPGRVIGAPALTVMDGMGVSAPGGGVGGCRG